LFLSSWYFPPLFLPNEGIHRVHATRHVQSVGERPLLATGDRLDGVGTMQEAAAAVADGKCLRETYGGSAS